MKTMGRSGWSGKRMTPACETRDMHGWTCLSDLGGERPYDDLTSTHLESNIDFGTTQEVSSPTPFDLN